MRALSVRRYHRDCGISRSSTGGSVSELETRAVELERIRAEYLKMPGMTLRLEQVARLCGVERSLCQRVLEALVDMRFLCVKPDAPTRAGVPT